MRRFYIWRFSQTVARMCIAIDFSLREEKKHVQNQKSKQKNIAEEIKPGDIVQHFKRTDDMQANEYLYRIIAEAKHTETNEYMVVYQAMYGDFQTYARPMAMFLSPVYKEK